MGIVISPRLLAEVYGLPAHRAAAWAPHMTEACRLAGINSELRLAHFLAQVGHESGRLRFTSELWGPTAQQKRYERDFSQPWPSRANRLAHTLGNERAGDGSLMRGHGLIQTTGRHNHRRTTAWLRQWWSNEAPDFEARPAQLALPLWAAVSAAAYWRARGLNRFADADDTVGLTRAVNGGLNGLADRQNLLVRAKIALARGL